MPLRRRHRETGRLTTSARGLILEVEDGGVYALDAEPEAIQFVGHRVTVEGVRSGFDRLEVDWIGHADARPELTPPSA